MTKKRANERKKVYLLLKSITLRAGLQPEIREVNYPGTRKEAWFSEKEKCIWINNATASFKKAERWGDKTKRYHVLRCSFDAILEWAMKNGKITPMEIFEIRDELFRKWGEIK